MKYYLYLFILVVVIHRMKQNNICKILEYRETIILSKFLIIVRIVDIRIEDRRY